MNLGKEKPLILDGAMGSLLQNFSTSNNALWSSLLNINNPEAVFNLHREYLKAGADIITTNTFRTNPAAIKRSGENLEPKYLIEKTVELALKAKNNYDVYVSGSNPPAEDCYQTERTLTNLELYDNHSHHIDLLMQCGVDFILNETQSHMDEIEIISEYCSSNKYPFIISLFFNNDLKLLSGEDVSFALNYIKEFAPICIMFNCIHYEQLEKLLDTVELNYDWGFYLNCGGTDYSESNLSCEITPKSYGEIIKRLVIKQPSIIGSCCGSSPAHTKILREIIDELYRN